ncbi:MAG: phage/plasmid primase, P4 family [Propionibacteriales bacterium]|nr:phage/plasmid primase, P4 family [Propionibacteriales bacterium]
MTADQKKIDAIKVRVGKSFIMAKPELTDAGLAGYLAPNHLALKYCPALGWYSWDGSSAPTSFAGVWREVPREAVRQTVRTLLTMHLEALAEYQVWAHDTYCTMKACSAECGRAEYYTGALMKYSSARALSGLVEELSIRPEVLVNDPALFDAHPHLFNCGNGVVNLTDGTLQKADPEWLITKRAGANYVPGAVHADWTQALDALSPLAEETRNWFQRYMGSGCSGHTLADSLNVFLHGNGANGKSTVLGAVDTALGDYAGTVPDAALESGSNYERNVALLAFRGLRFALLEETSDDLRLSTTALKKLSSGNEINARVLSRGNVTFPASHTLAIATNHTPYVRESDKGTWRRLVLVPFSKDYTREPSFDSEIRERLIEGADGRAEAVLAWLVQGCCQWYASKRKLVPLPAELQNATNEWREDTDLLGQFIADRVDVTGAATDRWAKSALYEAFGEWCLTTGNKAPYSSQRGFNAALKNHEYIAQAGVEDIRGTGGVKQWAGLRSLGHSSVIVETAA